MQMWQMLLVIAFSIGFSVGHIIHKLNKGFILPLVGVHHRIGGLSLGIGALATIYYYPKSEGKSSEQK